MSVCRHWRTARALADRVFVDFVFGSSPLHDGEAWAVSFPRRQRDRVWYPGRDNPVNMEDCARGRTTAENDLPFSCHDLRVRGQFGDLGAG